MGHGKKSKKKCDVKCEYKKAASPRKYCETEHLKDHKKKTIIHDHYIDVEEVHRYHLRKPKVRIECDQDCGSSSSSSSSSCPSSSSSSSSSSTCGSSSSSSSEWTF